jgi:hypothetical protein
MSSTVMCSIGVSGVYGYIVVAFMAVMYGHCSNFRLCSSMSFLIISSKVSPLRPSSARAFRVSLVSISVVFSDMNIATMGVIYKAVGGASIKAEERDGAT